MAGFSYVEVLVAVGLLAIALAPALLALDDALRAGAVASGVTSARLTLRAKMEEVLAEPYSALAAEASPPAAIAPSARYSDAAGTSGRRLVEIAPYDGDDADADGDPFTGTDADLLWVRVRFEDGSGAVTSLVTR